MRFGGMSLNALRRSPSQLILLSMWVRGGRVHVSTTAQLAAHDAQPIAPMCIHLLLTMQAHEGKDVKNCPMGPQVVGASTQSHP